MSEAFTLTGGLLVDGTGSEPRAADISVEGGRIVSIAEPGTTSATPETRTVDVTGLVVCPGFVDIHSHADYTLLRDGRAQSSLAQGVTSVAVGNCGHGIAPLSPRSADLAAMNIFGWTKEGEVAPSWRTFADYMQLLRDRGVGPNVFPLVAHGALRLSVAGFADRKLEKAEIETLRRDLESAMKAGAAGFSTGLEYAPGISAPTEELIEIARGMTGFDGLYATHCRNRSDAMDAAAAEAIAIAKAGTARLQMSHFVKRPNGTAEVVAKSWKLLDAARDEGLSVFADVFPFDYGPTPLAVLIPARLREGTRAEMAAKLREPAFRAQVMAGMGSMFEAAVKNDLVKSMFISADGTDGSWVGLSLADAAERLKMTAVDAAYALLQMAGENFYCVTIVENWVKWADLNEALEDRRFFVMGDGATGSLDGQQFTMALADWGYAPRFLSSFVRDGGRIGLADAIHRMSTGPARQLGLTDRGAIAVGQAADIVAFDLATIGSDVEPNDLLQAPKGITHVWVNGDSVVRQGQLTSALPGVVGLRR